MEWTQFTNEHGIWKKNGNITILVEPSQKWIDENSPKIDVEDLKQQKTQELDKLCTETILGRFKCMLNSIEYEFSYDMEAQSRFNGVAVLFLAGKITEMEWTAYTNGERVRIILTQSEFDVVSLAAMNHQATNIAKFNQLLSQVQTATTAAEVEAVVW
jgi:hypothetical protein